VQLDNDKAVAWLEKGAQPTETVRKLLEISGAWDQYAAAHPGRERQPRPAGAAATS
jgi:ribosomal protein S16